MAQAASFDITSTVDLQEVDNAVNQARKEIAQRYDFKGSRAAIELNQKENTIVLTADDEFKMTALWEILQTRMVRRGVPTKNLTPGTIERAANDTVRRTITLTQGIPTEAAKDILKFLKDQKLKKVQASIMADQVRVTSPSKDELQEAMRQLREQKIVEYLRYKNSYGEIIISPHKIEKYYNEHSGNYQVKDQAKLRMITLNKSGETNGQLQALATEIEGKIRAGTAFAEMAQTYSQDSYRQQGGARGWVERGELREAIDAAAFKLKAGETVTVETPESFYVLLAEEVKPAHVRPLNEIRVEIEKSLLDSERDRLALEYVNKLRRKTYVAYF